MRHSFTTTCAIIALLGLSSCSEPIEKVADRVFDRAVTQFEMLDSLVADDQTPKTFVDDESVNAGMVDWVSGFFPGSLWYVYEYTGNETVKALAGKNTLKLADICSLKTHHDIGFQVNCSYGNAYRITDDAAWLPTIEAAAAKLATRFNPTVGCIKSWDNPKWDYPVIIDNMMNLELLMNASKLFDCDSLAEIANTHAHTTMANHYRDDFSTYHLLAYDPETGEVVKKQTVQGYADDSAWARGQAWSLYGFTMMYRETGNEEYLERAERVAEFIIPNLPEDGVPHWDFNAPAEEGNDVLRDASAGAVMASALAELAGYEKDAKAARRYRAVAEKIVRTLATPEYLSEAGENGGFLLKHSVGHLPKNKEVDVPLTYADYYYLEALMKLTRW